MTTSTATTIDMTFDLPKPPATVWRALTDGELLAKWVMENDFQPVVGHRFTFRAKPMPHWDGIVHSEVLTVDEPKRLSYTWCAFTLDTVVTWDLESTADGGTKLSLTHTGFTPEQEQNRGGAVYGWNLMGQKLVDLVATL